VGLACVGLRLDLRFARNDLRLAPKDWRLDIRDSCTCLLIAFRVSRRQSEMYIGHASVCVSMCLSRTTFPQHCTDRDVTRGNGRGCRLVVHHWANLQSVHGFRCCDNIAPCGLAIGAHDSIAANAKCQRVLVLVLCPVENKYRRFAPMLLICGIVNTVDRCSPFLRFNSIF